VATGAQSASAEQASVENVGTFTAVLLPKGLPLAEPDVEPAGSMDAEGRSVGTSLVVVDVLVEGEGATGPWPLGGQATIAKGAIARTRAERVRRGDMTMRLLEPFDT
jgi:hypothetical protein